MQNNKDFKLKLSLIIILFCFIMFFAARLALLLMYGGFFAELTSGQIFTAFVEGLRFDAAVIVLFAGIPLFILNFPVKSRAWVKTWVFITAVFVMIMGGFLIGDIIYFPNVNRHITDELIYIGNDLGFLVKYILFKTPLQLLLLLATCGGFMYAVSLYINEKYVPQTSKWGKTALKLFLIFALIILGIRGHLGKDKPIGVADVYKYADGPAAAELTLNGVFTTYQITRKGGVDVKNDYPADKAIKNTQDLLIAKDEKVIDPQYPLMRRSVLPPAHKNINVFIVMLEDWSPYYIDALSGNHIGVTPAFDNIVRNGAVFTNAYAAGTRSIFGFAAILASLPMTPGLPIFGYGLEMNEMSPSFKNFADRGYYTMYAQTSLRHSYRMCALAKYLGAQEQYGWEDMPQRLPYLEKAPFGYDYDAFMLAADKIKARKQKNFFAMVFTGITHDPFVKTLPRFDIFKGGTKEDGFKNTLAFSDWSIGELLNRAKQDGWFDNTVFIFVSDHTNNYHPNKTVSDRFHIVYVFYAPKILKAKKYDTIVSQTDIMPTLYDMAGISEPYSAFGKNIFDDSKERWAFVYGGSEMGIVGKKGAISYSGGKLSETQTREKGFDAKHAEEVLLSFNKTALTLLKSNKWFKNEK